MIMISVIILSIENEYDKKLTILLNIEISWICDVF